MELNSAPKVNLFSAISASEPQVFMIFMLFMLFCRNVTYSETTMTLSISGEFGICHHFLSWSKLTSQAESFAFSPLTQCRKNSDIETPTMTMKYHEFVR